MESQVKNAIAANIRPIIRIIYFINFVQESVCQIREDSDLKPRSKKYPPKFGKNGPDIKHLFLSLETMNANNCYHDESHKIWNSYIVSDQKNTCYFLRYSIS